MLGKWKTTVQFVAIVLAMLRPDVTIAGAYLDEWVDGARRARSRPGRRVDYLLTLLRRRCAAAVVSRVFVTGGSGVVGGALVERLVTRGDEVDRARALGRRRARRSRRAAPTSCRGDVLDEDALARGMDGCELVFHVAGRQHALRRRPRADAPRQRRRRRGRRARRGRGAGVPRLVHTSSAATLGEPPGTVGTRGHAAPRLVPVDLRAHEDRGRARRAGRGARDRAGRRLRQPVLGAGARAAPSGTGRFLLAFLDGRLQRLRRHPRQPRRHRRLRRGPPARGRARRSRASATCSTG